MSLYRAIFSESGLRISIPKQKFYGIDASKKKFYGIDAWRSAWRNSGFINVSNEKLVFSPDSSQEGIWTSENPKKSSKAACPFPCVAHCVVGQLRDTTKAEFWREILDKAVKGFTPSEKNYRIFAVLSISGHDRNGIGRGRAQAYSFQEALDSVKKLNPTRAAILQEKCTTSDCNFAKSRLRFCSKDLRAKHNDSLPSDQNLAQLEKVDKIFKRAESYHRYSNADTQIDRTRQCYALLEEYEQENGFRFDFVTKIRPNNWQGGGAVPAVTRLIAYEKSLGARGMKNPIYFNNWVGRNCYGGMDWWYFFFQTFLALKICGT